MLLGIRQSVILAVEAQDRENNVSVITYGRSIDRIVICRFSEISNALAVMSCRECVLIKNKLEVTFIYAD